MMRCWRIAKAAHALDRTGAGARNDGGRWNRPGTAALYAGMTVEIAALEKFVHVNGVEPDDLQLVAIGVPDDAGLIEAANPAALPQGWDALPIQDASQDFGTRWLSGGSALALVVPSAILPEGRNVLINPLHARFARVTLAVVRSFRYDPRMLA